MATMPQTVVRVLLSLKCPWTIAAILALYLAVLLALPLDGFWTTDNGMRFLQMEAFTRFSDFAIPWNGKAIDPAMTFAPFVSPAVRFVDGKMYGAYSPFFPWASSGFYRAMGTAGLYVLPFLGTVALLAALWKLVGLLTQDETDLRAPRSTGVLMVALGTPVCFYAATFWEHVPATGCAGWAVYCLLRAQRDSRLRWSVGSAIAIGVGIWFRDILYVLALVLAIAIVIFVRPRIRSVLVFCAVCAVSVAPIWVFHHLAVGRPLGEHLHNALDLMQDLSQHIKDRAEVAYRLLVRCWPNNRAASWLLAGPGLVLLAWRPRLFEPRFQAAVPILAGLALVTTGAMFAGLLTAPSPLSWMLSGNGLMSSTPVFVLAAVRTRDEKNARALSTVWFVLLSYIGLYTLLAPVRASAGIHWGCRFLLEITPLLAVVAGLNLARWWKRGSQMGRVVVGATLGLALLMQVYSLWVLRERMAFSRDFRRAVSAAPERVVVSRDWFAPYELGTVFFDKTVFAMPPWTERTQLRGLLRDAGIDRALLVGKLGSDARAGRVVDDHLGYLRLGLDPLRVR